MTDQHYINMLYNSIIDDETGDSLEYRNLIKRDKHKNTWVEYFANELRHRAQWVGDRVMGDYTLLPLAYEK